MKHLKTYDQYFEAKLNGIASPNRPKGDKEGKNDINSNLRQQHEKEKGSMSNNNFTVEGSSDNIEDGKQNELKNENSPT